MSTAKYNIEHNHAAKECYVICYPHNMLWESYQLFTIRGMTKMIMKQNKLKFSFSYPTYEGCVHMSI